jgi:hypothetical protein
MLILWIALHKLAFRKIVKISFIEFVPQTAGFSRLSIAIGVNPWGIEIIFELR